MTYSALAKRMAKFLLPLKNQESLLNMIVIYEKDYLLGFDKGNSDQELFMINDFSSIEIESNNNKISKS